MGTEYKEHLRRLAVHDNTFVGSLTADETPWASALDARTTALVRVAATIALEGLLVATLFPRDAKMGSRGYASQIPGAARDGTGRGLFSR